jgi:hypothetical protein
MRALARPLAALSVTTLFAACVEILSLQGEPQDVAAAFCKCEAALFVNEDGEALDCTDYVGGALEGSDAATTRSWLDLFSSAHCEQCKNTDVCAAAAPVCRELGERCSPGFNASCCGYDPNDIGKVTCGIEDRCVPRDDSCVPTGENCDLAEFPSSCCGFCIEFPADSLCANECDPDNDTACPGCCLKVENSPDAVGLCVAGERCGFLSCSDEDGCPIGYACFPHAGEDGAVIYYCDLLMPP